MYFVKCFNYHAIPKCGCHTYAFKTKEKLAKATNKKLKAEAKKHGYKGKCEKSCTFRDHMIFEDFSLEF